MYRKFVLATGLSEVSWDSVAHDLQIAGIFKFLMNKFPK
jgi:hypothetical protein